MLCRRRAFIIAASVAVAAGLILPGAASASSSSRSIQMTVELGRATGPGMIQVNLEVAENYSKLGIPQKLVDEPIATIALSGGGTQTISVPVTPLVLEHTSSGLATFELFARFGNKEATGSASLPVAPATGNAAAAATTVSSMQFTPFTASEQPALSPHCPCPPPCIWAASGNPVETMSKIGQMQVSNSSGSSADWDYSVQADSTLQFGYSNTYDKNYTVGGTFTVSNSFSGDGGFTGGRGFNQFVYGHFYRQRYKSDGFLNKPICGHWYKTRYQTAVGDSFTLRHNKHTPKKDPYGRCQRDPHGLATMNPRTGHFGSDRATATTYSGAATIFNLSITATTGYTNDIHIDYHNHSSLYEYVCGNADMPNAPILWSNNSAGK